MLLAARTWTHHLKIVTTTRIKTLPYCFKSKGLVRIQTSKTKKYTSTTLLFNFSQARKRMRQESTNLTRKLRLSKASDRKSLIRLCKAWPNNHRNWNWKNTLHWSETSYKTLLLWTNRVNLTQITTSHLWKRSQNTWQQTSQKLIFRS